MWNEKRTDLSNGLLVFILGLLVTVNLGIYQVNAANLETSTTVLADKGTAGSGDTIRFAVWTYTGFDSVSFGQIRLTDVYTGIFVEVTLTNGTAEVDWIVPSPIQTGEHLFVAEYLGFYGNLPSNGSCSVIFEDVSPGSTHTTSLQLSINSTTVYKNASIHFTLDLFIHYRWWFQGGFITVTSINLTGSPVIWTVGPLDNYYPGTDPAVLTLEFDYEIPIFSPIGKTQFRASYTGSSQSQTSPCTSNLVNVTVLSSGYWLYQNINTTHLQRMEESVLLNTTVLGDNPSGLTLSLYYKINLQKTILAEIVLNSRNYQILFFPNSSIPLGDFSIYTELKNEFNDIYANITSIITIQDRARIQYYLNSSDFRLNETIHLEAYITLEDIHTVAVLCQVELVDLTEGNVSLMNKSTNANGYVSFIYSLPSNISIGNHEFLLQAFDFEPNILRVSCVIEVSIKGLIEFDLTYESGGIQRNTNTQIQVTIISGGFVINEGLVSFMYSNSTLINTQNCVAGLIFTYHIDNDHPLGDIYLIISFHDSTTYDEGTVTFKLTVFSVPRFDSLSQNSTELIQGQSGRFWGYLLDEDGEAVINEAIHFTDTTTGEYLGFVVANTEGIFFFDLLVTEVSQIGVHILQCSYQGNLGAFYLPTISPGIFSISVRPPLTLMIEASLLSNHWSVIELEGGLNQNINLHWQQDGSGLWEFITVVTLNASGLGSYNWTTPYYKGGLTLRASNINGTNNKYDHTYMYSIADIDIIGGEFGNVNDNYIFYVNCTEVYQIWINGQLWKDWSLSGLHSYSYIFSSRGIQEISVVSNDTYVFYRAFHHFVTIFEDLFISVSVPQEALVDMSINIDGTVIGEVSGPITGVDTILEIDGIEREVDSTDGAGLFDFIISFNQPGVYTVSAKVPLHADDYYNASVSIQFSIIIHSLPSNIEIISPVNNSVHGSILELTFHGNAVNYWYSITPLDHMNLTWSETVYRELSEGLYTCHVYGENSYGDITYTSSFFRIDETSPSLVIVSPKNESYNTNSVLLSFLTDEGELFIFLDNIRIHESSGTYLADLTEGDHNLTIQVRDLADNHITKTALFNVDTVVPFLTVYSPYNYSYIDSVLLSFSSDGDLILYFIPGIFSTNQTYISPTLVHLTIGNYLLYIYSFDSAGNFITRHVEFFVVEKVDLLVNSQLSVINLAGNYLLSTEVLSNPDFDRVGVYLNGSYYGLLSWDAFFQDYRISFQFPSPGIWEINLYANTVDGKYDFSTFLENWFPPNPTIISLSVSWESDYYELRTFIDSQSLNLDLVQVTLNETNYSLTNIYGDQWYTQIFTEPQNYTFKLHVWYPWDNEPSTSKEYSVYWYAPQIIIVDSDFERNGFNFEVRFEKVNASISIDNPQFTIESDSQSFSINGILVYESAIGSYQIWQFTSPWLVPDNWNYTLSVFDIYGHSHQLSGIFNSTDTPPEIRASSLIILDNTSTGVLYRVSVEVKDDFAVNEAFLYINGVKYTFTLINESFITLDIFLTPGSYVLQLSVIDDMNQETDEFLTNLQVQKSPYQTTTTEQVDQTDHFTSTSQENTQQGATSFSGIIGVIEVSLGVGLFLTLVVLSNSIMQKKER